MMRKRRHRTWLACFVLVCAVSAHADSVVVINEIMYHPATNEAALEWIELYNQCSVDVDISGWSLRGGIDYEFTNGVVVPYGGFIVVAVSPDDLGAITGYTNACGPFTGRLSNAGESIRLVNNTGRTMSEVDYRDGGDWPVAPDGSGVSLARKDEHNASGDPEAWDRSATVGGTPGATNDTYTPGDLRINEITAAWETDFRMELYNGSSNIAIDITGYTIRCAGLVTGVYVFGSQVIDPKSHLTIDNATLGFHPEDEDKLFLYDPATNVIDAAVTKNSLRARYPDGTGPWQYPATETTNGTNQVLIHDEIVINEIMYNYGGSSYQPYVGSSEEWIELHNRSATNVDIGNWELTDGISYEFAPGTIIAAGGFLVVARDKTALALKYPSIDIVGNYSGQLSDGGERILLVDDAGNTADEVRYHDRRPWPDYADGAGASLELRDPDADNSVPEAWAASSAGTDSVWNSYSFTATAANPVYDPNSANKFPELRIGLLYDGEVLIDNVSVIEDPTGTNRELMQNGTFEASTNKWRFMGTHKFSEVISDPDDPTNSCLRLLANGPMHYLSNRGESTLKFGGGYVNVTAGLDYRISFDAKWIGGCPQVHAELYYNEVVDTLPLILPSKLGTPGATNSMYQGNIGPTFRDAIHSPAVPPTGAPATVSVTATDPNGITGMTLWYSVAGGAWASVAMTPGPDDCYAGDIPAQGAGVSVEFYIEGVDSLSVTSRWPQQVDARAMLEFEDNLAATNKHNVRIIMDPGEWSLMMSGGVEEMSNHRMGCTVIYDESEIFYDCRIRLKGSMFSRPNGGFNVRFPADHLFRGVHSRLRLDHARLQEVVVLHMACRAGLIGNKYSDVVREMNPGGAGTYLMFMAEYGNVFLDEQFGNDSDGSLYKLEGYRVVNSATPSVPEGMKTMAGIGWIDADITDLGDDNEQYRWFMMLRNNRPRDDYDPYVAMAKTWTKTGAALQNAVDDVMDVDSWMQCFAMASLAGIGDMYTQGATHNLALYARPSDSRIVALPWDWDFTFSRGATSPLWGNKNLANIISLPVYTRVFHGHLYDMLNTTYSTNYMDRWLDHYEERLGITLDYSTYIVTRREYVLGQLPAQFPFNVSTTNTFSVAADTATIEGSGWIDVREMRLEGSDEPLSLTWLDSTNWVLNVPLAPGTNQLSVVTYGFHDAPIATNFFTINSTVAGRPLRDNLRVTELMYDPPGGSDYEFIELQNIGTNTLDIASVAFADGITFSFSGSSVTNLAPDEYVVVVRNLAGFSSIYNTNGMNVAGEYSGKLNNGGENVEILGQWGSEVLSFNYDVGRGWPLAAYEGAGHSLVPLVLDAQTNGALQYGGNWRASTYMGGSPGEADPPPITNVMLNEIISHTDWTNPPWDSNDKIELYNAGGSLVTFTNWYLSDDVANLKKWGIPGGTTIAPYSWLTFTEVDDFHNPITNGFGLSKVRETVFLSYLPGNTNDRIVDCARFKGQENDRSVSRYPDGGNYWYDSVGITTNEANAEPSNRVVISEIMYNPLATNEPADSYEEFVELQNRTSLPADLWTSEGPWQLDGLGYTFPPNTTIPAGGFLLVVGFDPVTNTAAVSQFLSAYGLATGEVAMVGPYGGKLSNRGERISLEKQLEPDWPDPDVPWVIVDEAIYFDQWPWPPEADGTSNSLQRIIGAESGNDPDNWEVSEPTPGSSSYDKRAFLTPKSGSEFLIYFSTVLEAIVEESMVSGSIHQIDFLMDGTNIFSTTNEPYTYTLDDVTNPGIYTLTAELVDDAGTVTSMPVLITTYGPVFVDNNGGASNITDFSATLNGTFAGCDQANTHFHWGTSDGGTNISAWTTQTQAGTRSNGLFSADIGGLAAGVRYYYRSRVTKGSTGEKWATSTASFVPKAIDVWPYRMKIAFDQYDKPETLNRFPLLVTFTNNMSGFSYDQMASSQAYDLRFTTEEATNVLVYDIERWDTNGTSYVWVKVPAQTSSSYIYAYWGRPATVPPPYAADKSLWDNGFAGVWHFNGDASDSSENGNNGTPFSTTTTNGVIGNALSFDGSSSAVVVGNYPKPTSNITVSAWIRTLNSPPAGMVIAANEGETIAGQFRLGLQPLGVKLQGQITLDDETDIAVVEGGMPWWTGGTNWHHVAIVANGSSIVLYNDGISMNTNTYTGMLKTDLSRFSIGCQVDDSGNPSTNFWDGAIDEMRISSAARSSNWIWACYINQGGSLSHDPTEVFWSHADYDGDGMGDKWEIEHFGGTNGMPMGDWDDDSDGDGFINLYEYVSGTVPTNPASLLDVTIDSSSGLPVVRYFTISPTDPTYTGKNRLYDLEDSSNLVGGAWLPVSGETDIPGSDSIESYTNTSPNVVRFFRVRAKLE